MIAADPDPGTQRRQRLTLLLGVVAVIFCVAVVCGAATIAAVTGLSAIRHMANAGVTALAATDTPQAAAALTPAAFTVAAPHAAVSPYITPTATAAQPVQIAPSVTATEPVTPGMTARQRRVFVDLWSAVEQHYVYQDYHGMDWQAVFTPTLHRINDGISDTRFYDMMSELVASLNDDHSVFLSPGEAHQEQSEYQGSGDYVGIGIVSDVNYARRYTYVLQVLPDSPAARAGLRPHDNILQINGKLSVLGNGDTNMELLRGAEGSTVTVTARTPGQLPRELVMTRTQISTYTPIEYHIITGTTRLGYLLIPTLFEDSIGRQVRAALLDMVKGGRLNGLIVDMRINNGGAYPVLVQTLGFFTSGNAGSLSDRSGVRMTMGVRPDRIANYLSMPLMVLIDHTTASYAEVFAGILQAKGRAKLVGQNTSGNIETLRAHQFEDGSQAWIAEEIFRLPDGSNWEGRGLTPDIPVAQAWDEISSDDDPVIAAAVAALNRGK
ncbi:MAG: S41 family peptidase [Chloroflexi bacterium]|nr:S41 family peptidase [Chloroflexota bacterium]